jgi:endonuclease/exonuclease/phosphatase family metal-dependent hydrolase
MTHTRSLSLAFVFLLGACAADDHPPLGESAADGALLADTPVLAHLLAALDASDLSAEDLFDGEQVRFVRAPDPTALLEGTQAENERRPVAGGRGLRVMSYNLALLDAQIFGVIDHARTPFLDERRFAIPHLVLSEGFDVVTVQELWREEDIERFEEAARQYGYRAFVSPRGEHNDGLATFLRREVLAGGYAVQSGSRAYTAQDGLEKFPGPNIERGYLWVAFRHAQAGPMRVFNTHMQAFPNQWLNRMRQARELGLEVVAQAVPGEVALVTGDMNSGPYYRDDAWLLPDGAEEPDWWSNAIAYPLLQHYGELHDVMVMGRSPETAAADVAQGKLVPNDPLTALVEPYGGGGYCEQPNHTFTATDCNLLYFQQYGGTEYPARLDHILVHDPEGRVRVGEAAMGFTEPRDFNGALIEVSDHYAVWAQLFIQPER